MQSVTLSKSINRFKKLASPRSVLAVAQSGLRNKGKHCNNINVFNMVMSIRQQLGLLEN